MPQPADPAERLGSPQRARDVVPGGLAAATGCSPDIDLVCLSGWGYALRLRR
jgi:hypothetical protein